MKPFIENLDETYQQDLRQQSETGGGEEATRSTLDPTYLATLYKFIQWTIEVWLLVLFPFSPSYLTYFILDSKFISQSSQSRPLECHHLFYKIPINS